MRRIGTLAIAILAASTLAYQTSAQSANLADGERMFRACVPCHSLEPNRNMTGPSLSELWNRKS
jgi:cytochrome c